MQVLRLTHPQDQDQHVTEIVPHFNQCNRIQKVGLGYSMNVDCDCSYAARSTADICIVTLTMRTSHGQIIGGNVRHHRRADQGRLVD